MTESFEITAEDAIRFYVKLCTDLGISGDQMKLAALDLIDDAIDAETLH